MLRIFGSLALFMAVIASGFYFYRLDRDAAKCDQACIAEFAEEP